MHFQTFRLHPPHAPPSSGDTSCSGRAWPPIRLRLSAVLRISFTARSLISRIRPYRVCVAGVRRPSALRTVFSFPVALHIPSPVCSYFQLVAGSTTTEGLSPSKDRSHWLELLAEASDLWRLAVHGYAQMENHYPLMLETLESQFVSNHALAE